MTVVGEAADFCVAAIGATEAWVATTRGALTTVAAGLPAATAVCSETIGARIGSACPRRIAGGGSLAGEASPGPERRSAAVRPLRTSSAN